MRQESQQQYVIAVLTLISIFSTSGETRRENAGGWLFDLRIIFPSWPGEDPAIQTARHS
jgi:hypothetical protein